MRRVFFGVALAITFVELYRCANIRPESSRFHPLLSAEITRRLDQYDPLCAEVMGVTGFPFTAGLQRRFDGSDPVDAVLPPRDPLNVKWRDLVAAGLLHETEERDLEQQLTGYRYELTARGRELYREAAWPGGETRAHFCLGRTALSQVLEIGKPYYTVEGLNVPARYQLIGREAQPELYDGRTAAALNLKPPTRWASGEILFPEARGLLVLQRETDKVLGWDPY